MYTRYKPLVFTKKIDTIIIDKYFGFSFFKIGEYTQKKIKSLKFLVLKNDLENVTINIDQKNLYNLELQRKKKLGNLDIGSNYKQDIENLNKFSNATLNLKKKDYDIKLRVKGDRIIHWYDKNETSYRIDLRGDDRIWGLEEFSVQKPITRNYVYEFIFHKFLEFESLISLKYFFINLFINDTDQGIYAVEEGFSKELIERNKKRNGPIFGLDENKGHVYPNITYDLYSNDFWQSNHPELIKSALLKLEKLKRNQIDVDEIFDLAKWAKFFAVIDLTANFHGSLPKSVKLYYNPVNAKFEPIGFDGHYNPSLFKDFILLDFLDEDNKDCSYICVGREWYLKFLKNKQFLKIYKQSLKTLSSDPSMNKFISLNSEMINFYNNQFLSETSKDDKIFYKGVGPYLYDNDYLLDRSRYIQKRVFELEKQSNLENLLDSGNLVRKNFLSVKEIIKQKENYILKNDLEIYDNFYLANNKFLIIEKGVSILFKKEVSILSEGSIYFNGTKEEPIVIFSEDKVGSLILTNNNYRFDNVVFKNLSYPKDKEKILHGGVNIINSTVKIKNIKISSSNSEDAINLISSDSNIDNLEVENISADAIDIDFGSLKFKNITCKNILNDCLDVSAAKVDGNYLKGNHIKDKGLSFGENSDGKISNVDFQNSKLAIAVKDGSKLKLSKYLLRNNEFDIAVFNKKKEYEGASLKLNDSIENIELNYLIGLDNEIIKDEVALKKIIDNSIINQIFY